MRSDRIIGLHIIRTIPIVIVVIFLSVSILNPLTAIPGVGIYIHKLLSFTQSFGILGVELFFVLSGFLIGSILIKVFARSVGFGFTEIRSFLVRRWFRTLPDYWLILTVILLLYTCLDITVPYLHYWQYFFFIQNLGYRQPAFFSESWSLAIEAWFYLTLPFILFIVSVCLRRFSAQRQVLVRYVSYAALFFALRVALIGNNITDPLYFDGGVRKIVLFRLDAYKAYRKLQTG
jgi:peptidoglycan/LPS O-acetylase OafA/YrhL